MTNPQNRVVNPTEPTLKEAGLTILPAGSGGLVTLWILAALSFVAGVLFLSQNGLGPLVFGAALLLCGAITLTGALVATHIGARLDRRP